MGTLSLSVFQMDDGLITLRLKLGQEGTLLLRLRTAYVGSGSLVVEARPYLGKRRMQLSGALFLFMSAGIVLSGCEEKGFTLSAHHLVEGHVIKSETVPIGKTRAVRILDRWLWMSTREEEVWRTWVTLVT